MGIDRKTGKRISPPFAHVKRKPFMPGWERDRELRGSDRNYGNVLSLWDRVFGTFVYGDTADVVYGLDITDPEQSDNIKYQMGLPFNRSVPTTSGK